MKTDLKLSHIEVVPGQQGRIDISVTNTADVIDGVTAIVDGINPDWIRLERPVVSLFPDSTESVTLVFDIPTTCPAGDYLVVARIVSTIDADRASVHDFWLTVTAVPSLAVELTPSIVTGGAQATIEAKVINTGNTTVEVSTLAVEPHREIDCTTNPANVVIPQGAEALVAIDLRGRRAWFGDPVSRSITFTAQVDLVEGAVAETTGTFKQRARVPRGVVTALILAGIVILWALIFLFVVTGMRRSDPPAKAVGTDLMNGPANIPLSRVAATVEGTVTASTTGEGVPRITVEALRVKPDTSTTSVGSAATDDDGVYSFKSLIPGTYKLRFSANGYQTVWFDEGIDEQSADEFTIGPNDTVERSVVLTGGSGQLLGSIALPPDAPPIPLTVTANLGGTIVAEQVTTDGKIDLQGLPTPATYKITVTGEGFDTQQFAQTLSGGEVSVMNTVTLSAATGTIEGTVSDANGPLPGVMVTARSGDIEIRSVTPTTGNVGQFRLVGLPTPQTYALTFELPKYSSSTIALSLAAGQSRTGLTAQLVGGNGTVTGTAVGTDGLPLGGLTVTVLGDNFTSETTTLTTDGAGGTAGSFTVTDLPVPGSYTISFSNDRIQTETLGAAFLAAGTQALGNVTLLPTTSLVGGVVTDAGTAAGLGEVTITLSDGIRQRTTTSATNPLGVFAFAGVPPGSYTLSFERTGFTTQVVLVQVVAGVDLARNATINGATTP